MNLTTPEIMNRRKTSLAKAGYELHRTNRTSLFSPIWRLNIDLLNPYFKNAHSFYSWMSYYFPEGEFNLLIVIAKRKEQLGKLKR